MDNFPVCDFCGCQETPFRNQNRGDQEKIKLDEDGLWICSDCQAKLINNPISHMDEDDNQLDEKVKALIGKSAGAICRTMDLPYTPPYQSIIDAASQIAYDEDRYMSAWLFVTQWLDRTTVWQSEDRSVKALVFTDGNIQIEKRI